MIKKYPNTRRRNEMPLIKCKTAKRTKGEVLSYSSAVRQLGDRVLCDIR